MDLSTREGRREQGRRIQAAAAEAGFSLEELAQEIGCSRALIYQYVSGGTLAQPDKVQRIARVVGKPLAFFYTEEGVPGEAGKKALEPPAPVSAEPRSVPSGEGVQEPPRSEVRQLREALADLERLAEAYSRPPDWRQYLATCQQILPLARQLRDREREARVLLAIGNARMRLAEPEEACDPLRQAVALFMELGADVWVRASRQSLGAAYLALGQVAAAQAEFSQVAEGSDWASRWQGNVSLAAVEEQLGRYQEALLRLEETLRIVEEQEPGTAQAQARLYVQGNFINVYLGCGDYRLALDLARQSFAEAERLSQGDQYVEAQLNIGVALLGLGQWPESEAWLRRAGQMARLLEDPARQSVAESMLALLEATVGRFEEAREHGRAALDLALSRQVRRSELYAQLNLGEIYLRSGWPRDARYPLTQALALARRQQIPRGEAQAHQLLGRVAAGLGEREVAAREWQQAWELSSSIGARPIQAEVHLGRAELAQARGEWEEAIQEASQALLLAADMGAPELTWRANHALARGYAAGLQEEAARDHFQAAWAALEAARELLRQAGSEDSLLEDPTRWLLYLDWARFLQERGEEAKARRVITESGWPPLERQWARTGPKE